MAPPQAPQALALVKAHTEINVQQLPSVGVQQQVAPSA